MNTGDYYECPTCSYATTSYPKFLRHGEEHSPTVKLSDLIALPFDAKSHIGNGHKLSQPTLAGFVACSCGLSFRTGVIVEKSTLNER